LAVENEPKKKNELGLKPIEVILGVIIGLSFTNASQVFIPISNIVDCNTSFTECHQLVNALGIFLAYFIVISGWLGYHESIKKHPHRGYWGVVRYGLDLVILFLVYYLVSIANPKAEDQYGMIFLWVPPAMFLCYMFWDLVKFREWETDRENVPASRLRYSAIYGIVAMLFSISYYCLNLYYGLNLDFWENKTSLDFAFICLSFILFLLYRIDKSLGLFPFKL
jgi:hypothetical protein